jgi:predicted DNA-binding transcriptional regulator AlpA
MTMDVREPNQATADVLLLSARRAADLCGKSLRTWRTWDAAGWIPKPVRIGRSTLWRADELRAWVEAGCPRREAWEATRGSR